MKHYFPVTINRGHISCQYSDRSESITARNHYYVTTPTLPAGTRYTSYHISNAERVEVMADEHGNLYEKKPVHEISGQKMGPGLLRDVGLTIYQVDVWFSGFDYDEHPSHHGYEYFFHKEEAQKFIAESERKYIYGKSYQAMDFQISDQKCYVLSPVPIELSSHDRQLVMAMRSSQPIAMPAYDTHYVKGSYEADLACALEESEKESRTTQGHWSFFSPAATSKPDPAKKTSLPNRFYCPISLEIMREPVLFMVDGNTYEKANLIEWLGKKRRSPLTNLEMTADQTINNTLQINRALVEEIAECKAACPELFETSVPTL